MSWFIVLMMIQIPDPSGSTTLPAACCRFVQALTVETSEQVHRSLGPGRYGTSSGGEKSFLMILRHRLSPRAGGDEKEDCYCCALNVTAKQAETYDRCAAERMSRADPTIKLDVRAYLFQDYIFLNHFSFVSREHTHRGSGPSWVRPHGSRCV